MQIMKKFSLLILGIFSGFIWNLSAQQDQILMKINGKDIQSSEFENLYTKNLELVQDSAQKDIDYYKDLFIDFKLELEDAYRKKYDTAGSFKRELKQYRDELAKKYLTDEEIIDSLTREAYNRMKEDVKVAHILIKLPSNASPKDTLKAYKRIMEIYKKAKAGEDFNRLAKQYSQDPSVRINAGELGYINVFHTVYPFETAAYNTPAGEISKPVRTKFGYHIIKVEDKRKARGEIEAAHIFIREKKGDSLAAKNKINEIYQKVIQNEESFEKLAKKYSEDKSSARNGGRLRRFGIREMIPEFEEKAFSLEKTGEVSKPFKSRYGWHIIKLLNKYPLPEYELVKEDIRARVSRDERAKMGEEKLMKTITNRFPVKEVTPLADLYPQIDPSFFQNSWKIPQGKLNKKPLFIINNDKIISVNDFYKYLYKHQQKKPEEYKNKKKILRRLYDDYKKEQLKKYYDARLEQIYPEFARIVKEYKEGLLLFNIKSDEVWNKAVQDTTGLQKFYEQNKENYRIPGRYIIYVAKTKSKKTAKKIQKEFEKGKDLNQLKKDFAGKEVVFKEIEIDRAEESPYAQLKTKKTVRIKKGNEYIVNHLKRTEESRIPPLKEIRGKVINDYQNYLEKQWIEKLKKEFPVEINEKNWQKLREKYKK